MKKIFVFIVLALSLFTGKAQLNTDQYFYIGRNRIYFGNYVSAIENLNIVIRLRPNLPEPYFYRGMAKHYIEDYRGAKLDYDKAIDIKPFYPEAYMYRGMANYELKNFKEALTDYSKALEYKSNDQAIYNNRGITKAAMEDLDGAIDDYTHAIDLDPMAANTYLNRSSAKQMKNDIAGAIKDCDAAIKIRPHYASAYLMRGIAKFEQKDYAGALRDYDICIRLDSKMAQAFVNRGIVKHQLEDLSGAIQDYDMAIRLNPEIATAWINRGIAKEANKLPGYEEDLKMAEQLDPKYAQFRRRVNEEQEKERQRRMYGFVLQAPNQKNQQGQNQNHTSGTTQTSGVAVNGSGQTGKGQTQNNQQLASNQTPAGQNGSNSSAATTNGSNQTSSSNGQNPSVTGSSPAKSAADSSFVEQNKDKGPVTQKRSRRNIVVEEGGDVTETEISRGMIQNKNVKIELQPDFCVSVFHKDSVDFERLQYYSVEIDALNHKSQNRPFLVITNKPLKSSSWHFDTTNDDFKYWDNNIKTNKKSTESLFNRGIYFDLLSNYDSAIEDFSKAITIDSRNVLAYFSRATSMTKRVDFIRMPGIIPEPETLQLEGKKANADKPKEEKILDYDDIIKDYETALFMNPKFFFAWFNMANVKVKKKEYEEALKNYSKAIELEPDFAEAYFNRGLTRIFLNDLDGGSLDLSKAGELGLTEAYNVIKRYCNQ